MQVLESIKLCAWVKTFTLCETEKTPHQSAQSLRKTVFVSLKYPTCRPSCWTKLSFIKTSIRTSWAKLYPPDTTTGVSSVGGGVSLTSTMGGVIALGVGANINPLFPSLSPRVHDS